MENINPTKEQSNTIIIIIIRRRIMIVNEKNNYNPYKRYILRPLSTENHFGRTRRKDERKAIETCEQSDNDT